MPKIKIISAKSKDSACLKAALDKGEPTDLTHVGLFADGVAVKRVVTKHSVYANNILMIWYWSIVMKCAQQ